MIGNRCVLAALLPTLLAASVATGQTPHLGEGVVSGSGTVVLKRVPDTLRMKLDVFAQGKTIQAALVNLKDRRDAVRSQIEALGAIEKTIAFGDPQVSTSLLERQQQMEMMIRSRMGARGQQASKKGSALPVIVSCSLAVEWALKGKGVEELLIAATPLQDKLRAADLAGKKDLEKLGAGDEELSEEMAGLTASMSSRENGAQPGDPVFLFVSKISDQENAQAMAQAYLKARGQAEAVAKSAGESLGPLRHLESQTQAAADSENYSGYPQAYLRMMQGARGEQVEEAASLEAQGAQPGAVSYRVTVTAAFALK